MNAELIYNQKTAKWNLWDCGTKQVVRKDYDKAELVKWASTNGYSNIVRK